MLTSVHGRIVDANGKPVRLRGVNLGGWLLMEGFILGGRNIPEHLFLDQMERSLGKTAARALLEQFWKNYITEKDIARIKQLGFNFVRLPFHYGLFTGGRLAGGERYLHDAVRWCSRHGIYCLLDMHAAPGSQNADWHSDSTGKSLFWENPVYRSRAIRMWEELADRYKDNPWVAGYNVLNEPVTDKHAVLKRYYKDAVAALRAVDPRHLIFLDGNIWSQDYSFLDGSFSGNIVLSPHFYLPIDYVMNFVPHTRYPGRIANELWSKNKLRACLKRYYDLGRRFNMPVAICEFGVNCAPGLPRGELRWLADTLSVFNEYDFSWAYWTYKTVSIATLPTGLHEYVPNDKWIKREGPDYGWESYGSLPKALRAKLPAAWRTESYTPHRQLTKVLTAGL